MANTEDTAPPREINGSINNAYVEYLENKVEYLEDKLYGVKSAIELAEDWAEDQANGLTDGEVCIAAMKAIRRRTR